MGSNTLVTLLVLLVSLALTGYGFYLVLATTSKQDSTLPGGVLQRQLRGFGFMILASIIGTVGVNMSR